MISALEPERSAGSKLTMAVKLSNRAETDMPP